MRGKNVEAHAADALLDRRLTVNLPAPWLFRLLGKRTIPYGVPFPTGETLCRMAALFCRMELDLKELRAGDLGTTLACVAKNARQVSRVIAEGMLRDGLLYRPLVRPLAWYIRRHMTMRGMAELARVILLLASPEAFISIIFSVATMNMMEPTESQATREGS